MRTAFIAKQKTCFILAAGKGTRMLPLTSDIPKPLLKIDHRPMIDYTLDLLKFHGFRRIGINISYLSGKIRSHLRERNIQLVSERNPTGTAGGVLSIARRLKPDSPFLIISSDMMVNFDLSEIYKFHIKHGGIATVCCYFRSKSKLILGKSGLVLFDKKTKRIIQIDERPERIISQWVNSSVYIFDPLVLKLIPKGDTVDIAKDLIPKLLKQNLPVFAYPVNNRKFYQLGIDTPDRILQAEKDIASGKFIPATL